MFLVTFYGASGGVLKRASYHTWSAIYISRPVDCVRIEVSIGG